MSEFKTKLTITIEYMPGKQMIGGFHYRTNKPFIRTPEWLHSMDDTEYDAFSKAFMEFQRRFFPEDCVYVPRRKTHEERATEPKEMKKFAQHLKQKQVRLESKYLPKEKINYKKKKTDKDLEKHSQQKTELNNTFPLHVLQEENDKPNNNNSLCD